VAEDRAVLHQAVVEEHLLPALDVTLGVEHLPGRVHHPLRDRRLGLVGPVGEQAEDEEAEQHNEDDALHPALGNEQSRSFSGHAPPLCVRCAARAI
jgi:hypothetical protein